MTDMKKKVDDIKNKYKEAFRENSSDVRINFNSGIDELLEAYEQKLQEYKEELTDVVTCGNHFQSRITELEAELAGVREKLSVENITGVMIDLFAAEQKERSVFLKARQQGQRYNIAQKIAQAINKLLDNN